MTDLLGQVRQALAELELVSHAPIGAYGRQTPDTTDSKGGRRPPGADYEFRPRRPSSPLREGDAASEKEWAEFDEELAAWEACYHRRTVGFYRRLLRERGPSEELVREILQTAQAWKRQPIPSGQEPEYGSPQWKRYIGASTESVGELARRFNCKRQYIIRIQREYGTEESRRARASRNPHLRTIGDWDDKVPPA